MVLHMSRPVKNSKTGVFYFRQKTPADLRRTFGKAEVSWSLNTKDEAEAKTRHAEAFQKQARVWQALRAKPEPIPHKKIMTMAGGFYRTLVASVEDEPGEPSMWTTMLDKFDKNQLTDQVIEKWFGPEADRLLLEEGLSTDTYSHNRLCAALHDVWLQWSEFQLKRSQGDYSPDQKADRFPLSQHPRAASKAPLKAPEEVTITSLFELWERDHLANDKPQKTADDFRQKINDLKAFLGHDDALRTTGENIADWCDHLRHEKEFAPKTVRDKYLAAAKSVFNAGTGRRKLATNPTDGVKVSVPKTKKTRSKGFTDDEASAILAATLCDPSTFGAMEERNKMAIRWVPWICAFSGARISEITQMRREDLLEDYGIACIRITPEAGSVKTGNYRIVPLHPQLIAMGLLEFIQSQPDGPIFYSPKKADENSGTRAKNAGKKIGQWVRGVAGVTDLRVWPNHGWRHRFKTLARDFDIDTEYSNAITGHEDGRVSTDYGETTVKALWREIQKLPHYDV
ncbi:hypothetical protein LY56_02984 [Roseinatronobacter thiooxidans]|uniref:DUF6538 domain-containing protein n=2 Tax=Roseinatronobacter thiooxidans TaxID=121821 RepID=A0A2W7QKA1_9RHOB|nr:hypothetical protein LY56_02984 [Roseinatronobacter thiooxidans]